MAVIHRLHKGGRPRRPGNDSKPIIGAQVEPAEETQIGDIAKRLNRTRSYIIRVAIRRLIADDTAGRIDWSADIEKAIGV